MLHITNLRNRNAVVFAVCAALLSASAALADGRTLDTAKQILTPAKETPTLAGTIPDCAGDASTLLYPLDASYSLVDFFGDGPTGSGAALGPDQHNDDDSAIVALPFTFDLYGDLYTTCWINNNGNITFTSFYSSFVPVGFPDASILPMVAPFWGDVDTGNPSNFIGDVWMKFLDSGGPIGVDTLIVTWENVGYYNEQADKRNTFQMAISDGSNPGMGLGNNVCFSYDNMCWTTGSASGGMGGFGGSPATVGANKGDGFDFFQVGLFDHPGVDYDGPGGGNDGVSYLDGLTFCFSTSTTTGNIPPIPVGFPPAGYTIDCTSDPLDATLSFISPEAGQTTTITVSDPDGAQAAGLSIVLTPGNPATIDLDWTPGAGDAGLYTLIFTGTDDFAPPASTAQTLIIEVLCDDEKEPCMNIANQKVFCPLGQQQCFIWSADITNKSGLDAHYVLIPTQAVFPEGVTVSPNVINLVNQDGSLLEDGETTHIEVTICGGEPGDEVCFDVTLAEPDFDVCCNDTVCIILPECDCGQLREQEITDVLCNDDIVSFTFSFVLDNLSGFIAEDVFFIPFNDEQGYFAKDYFELPPLPPGGSEAMQLQILNAVPGEQFCFLVVLLLPGDDCCCAFEKCITVPPCSQDCVTCTFDLNCDHIVNGFDLAILLGEWTGGGSYSPCPPFQPADFNADCKINGFDLAMLLGAWGPCP